jgi:hypothetical protein
MLVAAVDGDLCAAVPLNGGRAIADPFRRTAEIVGMLTARAGQLREPAPSSSRWLPMRASRAARAGANG